MDNNKKKLNYTADIKYTEDYSTLYSHKEDSFTQSYSSVIYDEDNTFMTNINNNMNTLILLIPGLPIELQTAINQVFKPILLDWREWLKDEKYPIRIPDPDIPDIKDIPPGDKDPEGKDPENKDPSNKDPEDKDPEKDPEDKDPEKAPEDKDPDKDPEDKDPEDKDPEKDPEDKDPEKDPDNKDPEKDPEYKDPNKDPDDKDPDKDPDDKNPDDKDPEDKDPDDKDPEGKDPENKDPDGKDPWYPGPMPPGAIDPPGITPITPTPKEPWKPGATPPTNIKNPENDDDLFAPAASKKYDYRDLTKEEKIQMAELEFIKNIADVYSYYTFRLKKTVSDYYTQLLALCGSNIGTADLDFLVGTITQEEADAISGAVRHLMDMALRFEVIGGLKVLFSKNMFSLESTLYHLKNLKTTQELRLRYIKTDRLPDDSRENSLSNRMLKGMLELYNSKYDNAYINLYKYLNSSLDVLEDVMRTLITGLKSKETIIKKGGVNK